MIRYILGKPFEWLMRISYKIHLALDQNSDWFCLNTFELDDICREYAKDYDNIIDLFDIRDGSIDFNCECDCI